MLEILVVLTLIALLAGLSFASLRPSSETLLLSRKIAELEARFATDRLTAVRTGVLVETGVSELACDPDSGDIAGFRPDGSTFGPDLCLREERLSKRMAFDLLTGRLIEAPQ